MKFKKEGYTISVSCTVDTKPRPHPFHFVMKDVDSIDEIKDIKSHIHNAYAKNMEPIIKACTGMSLKNQMNKYVAFARFKNITITEVVSKTYEVEEEETE